MREKLDERDIRYDETSVCDEVGRVFYFNGRIFRGINPEFVDAVRKEFEIGLVQRLAEEGLIPETTITEIETDMYPMVLEHKSMQLQIYNREMSFTMMKDCANLVLRLAKVLAGFGYFLKDCHTYNIMFDKSRPVYVDFGSIKKGVFSFPYYEFMEFYVWPMKVMSLDPRSANQFIRQSHSINNRDYISHYYGIKHESTRYLASFMSRLENKIYRGSESMLNRLHCKIKNVRQRKSDTAWGGYQSGGLQDLLDGKIDEKRFGRYGRILEILKKIEPKTVVEYGCNGGLFAVLCMEQGIAENYIATDYDEVAINMLYAFIKDHRSSFPFLENIYPAVVDFCEIHKRCAEKTQFERFRSDVCIAMALTHHLLLTQFIPMRTMFQQFYDSTKEYLIIEFMPKGLWDGHSAPPLPSWYNKNAFEQEMQFFFEIIMEEQLEDNRIVFLARKLERADLNNT